MRGMSRRDFINASGAAAGVGLAASIQHEARGDGGKIRLGIIGTGARGQQHLREGLWGSKDFEIVAVADTFPEHRDEGAYLAWLANAELVFASQQNLPESMRQKLDTVAQPRAYSNCQAMLAAEDLNAVVIATPPHTHASTIIECLRSGRHVFCESPMTTGAAEARELVTRAREFGRVVQIGHQRRYHPNYNLAASPHYRRGRLQRLVQAVVYDHVNRDGRDRSFRRVLSPAEPGYQRWDEEDRYLNWRMYTTPDGGPCLCALPAAMDTVNWFCGTIPSRVFVSGGIDYWFDGRDTPDNFTAVFDYAIRRDSAGFNLVDGRNQHQDIRALNRSYTLRCTYSYNLASSEFGASERILGDGATLTLSLVDPCSCRREPWVNVELDFSAQERKAIWSRHKAMLDAMSMQERLSYEYSRGQSSPPPPEFDRHAAEFRLITAIGSEESAEVHQFRAFADHIRNGGTPRANVMVGLAAVITGESARRSLESGTPVDIDPDLMRFDFETPSISDYDRNAAPIPTEVTEAYTTGAR